MLLLTNDIDILEIMVPPAAASAGCFEVHSGPRDFSRPLKFCPDFRGRAEITSRNFSNTLARCDLGVGSELGRPVRALRESGLVCVLRSSYSSARQLLSAFLLLRFFLCSLLHFALLPQLIISSFSPFSKTKGTFCL